MNGDDDDDTTTLNTTLTKAMAEDGTCLKHPSVKLKGHDSTGAPFLLESCPECDAEFAHQRSALKQKKRALDWQLQQLQLNDKGGAYNPTTAASNKDPAVRLEQLYDYVLTSKDNEIAALQKKVDEQQQLLVDHQIEIALLKERLTVVVKGGGGPAAQREIHIQELHVTVAGGDGSDGPMDPAQVKAATAAATTAAIQSAEQSVQHVQLNNDIGMNGDKQRGGGGIETVMEQEEAPAAASRDITFVPPVAANENKGDESDDDDDEEDSFQAEPSSLQNKSPRANKQQQQQPGPLQQAAAAAEAQKFMSTNPNQRRKEPMRASTRSLQQPSSKDRGGGKQQNGGVGRNTAAPLLTTATAAPTRATVESSNRVAGVPKDIPKEFGYYKGQVPSIVPSQEEVTLATGLPSVGGDDAHTVESSTFGEDRQKVKNQTLLDPYGDKGVFTGTVLRSTGMPHGMGRMVYEDDGRTYEGDWRHGRWHGYGQASFANGDTYQGEYRFDQRHGRGIYCWNDGRVYDGQFSEDKRHGKGTFKWPDGATYEGDFVQGQREGHGRYTFSDGGYYVGNWVDGRYDGYGVCHWEDGRIYKGEWKAGQAHGLGVETYPDGRTRHDGQWQQDEPIRV